MALSVRGQMLPVTLAFILFAVLINAGDTGWKWYQRQQPAITWHGVDVVTKNVEMGGLLTMVYKAQINRQCPADLRSFLEAEDGTVPVRYPVIGGGYTKPSEEIQNVKVTVLIPKVSDPSLAPLKPGRHVYRTMATRYCAEGVEDGDKIPDVPFMLEPAK